MDVTIYAGCDQTFAQCRTHELRIATYIGSFVTWPIACGLLPIGSVFGEYLDPEFFWSAIDVFRELKAFNGYYSIQRARRALADSAPVQCAEARLCQRSPVYLETDHFPT